VNLSLMMMQGDIILAEKDFNFAEYDSDVI
jgi:hypothetical protein